MFNLFKNYVWIFKELSLTTLMFAILCCLNIQLAVAESSFDDAPKGDPSQSSATNPLSEVVPCFGGSCESEEIKKLPQGDFRDEFLPAATRFLIYAMGGVSFIIFFAAGVMYVLSWGNEEDIKKATNMIIYGIMGIACTGASYALVKGILGINFS